jgi:hypothetical protein
MCRMSGLRPRTATTLWPVTARDGSAGGHTVPPPTTSFARRHPILAGFGVLAGLSLFAAYFPLSAIVTGVLVGVRASEADRAAVRLGRRVGSELVQRWRTRHQREVAPSPAPPATEPPASPPLASLEAHALAQRAVGSTSVQRGAPRRQPQSSLHHPSGGHRDRGRRVQGRGERVATPSRPGPDDRGLGDL